MAPPEPGAVATGPPLPASGPAAAPSQAAADEGSPHTGGRLALAAFRRNRPAMAGAGFIVAVTLFCFLGPLLYRTSQVTVSLPQANLPPSGQYPLGTNGLGFDILGRLMVSGRSSLELGFAVSIATAVIGSLYGAVAGLAGGIVDAIMMRVIDTFLAIPGLVLLLILVNLFTPNLLIIIALLTLLSWLTSARLVRAEVLTLRTREFVQAARMMGGTGRRLLARHLLPNAIGVIVVNATFTIADAVLILSTLSFLGLGLPPPATDWGAMLNQGVDNLFNGYWWQVYPPAVILIVTVIAFNLIGDGIRDSLDVRTQRR